MDLYRQIITRLMPTNSQLIREARVRHQIRLLLPKRILRQTKTIFSPSQEIKEWVNFLQRLPNWRPKTKSHLPNPLHLKKPRNQLKKRKPFTQGPFTQRTQSKCTLTALPNSLSPQKQESRPQTQTR